MTLTSGALIEAAAAATGLGDFGGDSFRQGLDVLTTALRNEAELSELGASIMEMRLQGLLENRLRVQATMTTHPEIERQPVTTPIFIIGLPRTGTTALSNLLYADPAIRSLRMWESSSPVPPPEAATQHDDPRIAEAKAGLEAMDEAFPLMKQLHFQDPNGPTECQDRLGMEFRTTHFDGMAVVPTYTEWAMACDMTPAYEWHRRTLQLLQWHCPPRQWHLKTPVHMLSLPALDAIYPDARFIWTHRDPAEVMGSVCSLIAYVRSWVSDQGSPGIGEEQVAVWTESLRRAMHFRDSADARRFTDVSFVELTTEPVTTVVGALDTLGLGCDDESRAAIGAWAEGHPPGAAGRHEFTLDDYGLTQARVHDQFDFYLDRFGTLATNRPR
ncbi:MAG: sulfotransferase family protein [Acidimicrobiales bacterium]